MTWPMASPMPSELANQARPRPAARPPSMAPQGFLGAAAAGAAVAGDFVAAAWWAQRCRSRLTLRHVAGLLAKRLAAAKALGSFGMSGQQAPDSSSTTQSHRFIPSPNFMNKNIRRTRLANSTLDSDMQGYQTTGHVVVIHMTKAIIFHQGFELLLAGMHANRLGQILVAGGVTGHPARPAWAAP